MPFPTIAPFETEHFYAAYEFNTAHQLCNSDCESITVAELLALADVSLADFGHLGLGYTESQGNPALRSAIAAQYSGPTAEQIVVLGTPIEGIYLTARALLQPGDEVIVLTPAYDALVNTFAHVVGDAHVKRWWLTAAPGEWQMDLDALRQLITPRTKLVVVNFPHNPTGFLPTAAQLAELVAVVAQAGIWLFSDEMYRGLWHSGTAAIPSAAELYGRAIVLSGLSKTHGLPGLRTGWLVLPAADLRANLLNWKFYTSICPPAPSEFLAQVALQAAEPLRQKNSALIERNLALAEAFFGRWPTLFTWRRPCAGSVALVGMAVPSVSAVAQRMVAEAGVLIQPAATLGYDDHHFRMGFGRAAFPTALAAFEKALERIAECGTGNAE